MASHEIPNAFLIQALARSEASRCAHCGSRMFVERPSGLCPFCLSGRPPRTEAVSHAQPAHLPFAPRIGEPAPAPISLGRLASRWRQRSGHRSRSGWSPASRQAAEASPS